MKSSITRGLGLAVVLAAVCGSAQATLLSVNFNDGLDHNFVLPTNGDGSWMVLQPDLTPWQSGKNGVLWQTNTVVTTQDGGLAYSTYVRRLGTLGSYTNSFSFTALVHVDALDPNLVNFQRIGLVAFSNGGAADLDPKLELMLTGNQLRLFTEYSGNVGPTAAAAFSILAGHDYTLRLTVLGGTLLGEVWDGDTTAGDPVSVTGDTSSNHYPPNATAQAIGFIGTGGSVYFDNVVVNEIVPEPSVAMLLLTGGGLWFWKRAAKK